MDKNPKEKPIKKVIYMALEEVEIVETEQETKGVFSFSSTVRMIIREWASFRQAIADGRLIWKG